MTISKLHFAFSPFPFFLFLFQIENKGKLIKNQKNIFSKNVNLNLDTFFDQLETPINSINKKLTLNYKMIRHKIYKTIHWVKSIVSSLFHLIDA